MEVDFLQFVLLDDKYKINLGEGCNDMQCWKGYLFYACKDAVRVCRIGGRVLMGKGNVNVLFEQEASGLKGLIVTGNTLCYYTGKMMYSVECEKFIRGEAEIQNTPFEGRGTIEKITAKAILTTEGRLFERVGFECVAQRVIDVDSMYYLDLEGVRQVDGGKLVATVGLPGFEPCSLHVLREGLFAVGFFDGTEYNLCVVSKDKAWNLRNLTNAFAESNATGRYSVQYIHDWGKVNGLIVASHQLSIRLALAGRLSEDWTVLEPTSDEYTAEMPMSADASDTFPVCTALDTHCTFRYKVPDDRFEVLEYPPCPVVLTLTTDGRLVPFQVVNTECLEPLTIMEPLEEDFVKLESSPSIVPGFLATSSSDISSTTEGVKVDEPVIKIDTGSKPVAAIENVIAQKEEPRIVVSEPQRPREPVKATTLPVLHGKKQESVHVKVTEESKKIDNREETKDFSPKQNTLMKAFVDIHTVHTKNLQSMRTALEELVKLKSSLKQAQQVQSMLGNAEQVVDGKLEQRCQALRLAESIKRIKERIRHLKQSLGENDEISTALLGHKDDLEDGLCKAHAYYDYCKSMAGLKLDDRQEELRSAALEQINSCMQLLNSCLSSGAEPYFHKEPTVESLSRSADLKRILGKRRVELRTVQISPAQITARKPADTKPITLTHFNPIPSFSSFNRQSVDIPKVENATPPPVTPTGVVSQSAIKFANSLTQAEPIVRPSSPAASQPIRTAKSEENKFSFASASPVGSEKSQVLTAGRKEPSFDFKPAEGKQTSQQEPNNGPLPKITQPVIQPEPSLFGLSLGTQTVSTVQAEPHTFSFAPMKPIDTRPKPGLPRLESPEPSQLATPSRPPPNIAFGQTAAFAPVIPPAFSTPTTTFGAGSAAGGFAAFANQQPGFGTLGSGSDALGTGNNNDPPTEQKPRLPPSFTQFRG